MLVHARCMLDTPPLVLGVTLQTESLWSVERDRVVDLPGAVGVCALEGGLLRRLCLCGLRVRCGRSVSRLPDGQTVRRTFRGRRLSLCGLCRFGRRHRFCTSAPSAASTATMSHPPANTRPRRRACHAAAVPTPPESTHTLTLRVFTLSSSSSSSSSVSASRRLLASFRQIRSVGMS